MTFSTETLYITAEQNHTPKAVAEAIIQQGLTLLSITKCKSRRTGILYTNLKNKIQTKCKNNNSLTLLSSWPAFSSCQLQTTINTEDWLSQLIFTCCSNTIWTFSHISEKSVEHGRNFYNKFRYSKNSKNSLLNLHNVPSIISSHKNDKHLSSTEHGQYAILF